MAAGSQQGGGWFGRGGWCLLVWHRLCGVVLNTGKMGLESILGRQERDGLLAPINGDACPFAAISLL